MCPPLVKPSRAARPPEDRQTVQGRAAGRGAGPAWYPRSQTLPRAGPGGGASSNVD